MARVQIAAAMLSGNSLRQTVHTHCASVRSVIEYGLPLRFSKFSIAFIVTKASFTADELYCNELNKST